MATENVNVIFRATGAHVIKRSLDDIGRSADRATRGLYLLQRAIFVIGGAGAVAALTNVADSLTNLENRLRLTTTSTEQLEEVQANLFKTANNSRSAFDAVSAIYTRTALSTKALGLSQQETAGFTESLAKATILSGASAREANAALIQLAQGMASNRLSGDEMRSVLEQLPYVADVIARHMGATRGELRKLGSEGKVSAQIILEAFRSAEQEIDDLFSDTTPTISQALTIASNNFKQFVDNFDDATGSSAVLANAIISLSGSIDSLISVATIAAATIAGLYADKFVRALGSQISMHREYTRSIREGNTVLLNSARAEQMRADYALSTATATDKAAQAKTRDLYATRSQLQSNLQLIQAQRASQAFTVQNNRARSVATGHFVNLTRAQNDYNSSTKAMIATQRALRNVEGQLAAAQGLATAAALDLATAQHTSAAASARAQTVVGRLALQFPVLEAAVLGASRALRGMFAWIAANPLTIALLGFTALSVILGRVKSDAEKVSASLEYVEKAVADIKRASEEAEGSVGSLADRLREVSIAGTLVELEKARGLFSVTTAELTGLVELFSEMFNMRGVSDELRASVQDITDDFQSGAIGASELISRLDALASELGDPRFAAYAKTLIDQARTTRNSEEAVAKLEATLRVLNGTATQADRILVGLASAGETYAASVGNAAQALDLFRSKIPILKEAAEAQEQIADLQKSLDLGEREIISRVGVGINVDEAAAQIQELRDLFSQAVSEVDGSAESTRDAEKALSDYARSAEAVGKTGLDRAISAARSEYDELRKKLVDADASQEQLTSASKTYLSILRTLREEDRSRVLREEAEALDDVRKSLEQYSYQASLLSQSDVDKALSQAEREYQNLKTAAEEAGASIFDILKLWQDYQTVREDIVFADVVRQLREESAAFEQATDALEEYVSRAAMIGKTESDRSLTQAEQEYRGIYDALVQAGAGQDRLTAALRAYHAIRGELKEQERIRALEEETQALEQATSALERYVFQTSLLGKTGSERALAQAEQEYRGVYDALVQAGAGQDQLTEALRTYLTVRRNIDEEERTSQLEKEAEALNKVSNALEDYSFRASLLGKSSVDQALARAEQEYEDLKKAAEDAGASIFAILRLWNDYQKVRQNIVDEGEIDNLKKVEDFVNAIGGSLRDLQDEFENSNSSLRQMAQNVEGLSLSETMLRISEATSLVEEAAERAGQKMTELTRIVASPAAREEIDRLSEAFSRGEISVSVLASRVDRLAAASGDPVFMKLASDISEQARASGAAESSVDTLEAILRVLTGTATAADRALLGLASSTDEVAAAAGRAASAVDFFVSKIPALREAARMQGEIQEAQAHLAAGRAEIAGRVSAGGMSIDAAASEISRLNDLYGQAISEIDGTAESLREADKALSGYNDRAELASRTGIDRALHSASVEYERLRKQATEAGASVEDLTKLEQNYQRIVAGIRRDEASKGGRKGRGGSKDPDFLERLAEMTRETELLGLSNRERAVQENLLRLEKDLKRSLTESERELATERLNNLESVRVQAQVLSELKDPLDALLERQDALHTLYENGMITLQQYADALRELRAEIDAQSGGGLMGGIKSSIGDAIMSAEEFALAFGDKIVQSVESATEALVNFAKTGKLSIRDFFFELSAQLFKLAANQLILKLLGSLMGIPMTPATPVPGFSSGGSIPASGPGNTDSQLVVFKKRPDEHVDILTPAQHRNQKKRVLEQVLGTSDQDQVRRIVEPQKKAYEDLMKKSPEMENEKSNVQQFQRILRMANPIQLPEPAIQKSVERYETNTLYKADSVHHRAGTFATGGSILPSGSGNRDTQLVSFYKRPDERIDVMTPAQQKQEKDRGDKQKDSETQDLNIVNVLDPTIVGRYLQTTDGRRTLINILGEEGVLNR